MKKASIIVPIYKKFDNLEKNLNSIFSQTYENIEVIITDDGSENYDEIKVRKIVEKYNVKDKKVVLYHHLKNVGTVKNLNNAIKISTGEYIFFLAQDDKFHTDTVIETILEKWDESFFIVTTYRNCVDNYGNLIEQLPKLYEVERFKLKNRYLDLLINGNFISGACTYYKKEVFDKYGLFDESYRLLEDYPYYLNFFKNKEKILFLNEVSIDYGMEGISNNKEKNIKLIEDFEKVYKKEYEKVINETKGYQRRILKYIYAKFKKEKNIKLIYFDVYLLKKFCKIFSVNLNELIYK